MLSTKTALPALLVTGLLLCACVVMAANTAPAPPVDVQVTDSSTPTVSSLHLSFGKSPDDHAGANDVVKYKIFKRLEGQPPVYLSPITAIGAAKYQREITGLTSGTRYGIGVVAFDGSLESTAVVVWITPFYLPPPVSLTLTDPPADNGTTLDIKFFRSTGDAVGGPITTYAVYKRTATGPFTWVKAIPATHATSYSATITGLSRGVSTGIGVRATDGSHFSAYLTGWCTPQDTVVPAPPRDPVLINPTGDTGTTMQLRFANSVDDAAGKDVQSYKLYKKTASSEFALAGTVKATHATSYGYTFRGLTVGMRYCFAAAAFDGTNESEKVQVWGDSSPPGPARNLKVADVPADTGTALKLTFDRSVDDGTGAADVTEYRILKRTETTAAVQIGTLTATGAASYTYTASGLTKDVKYGLVVLAWDGFQPSAPALIWGTPKDNIPPASPTGLVISDWPADDGTSLKITFQRSPDDSGTTPKTLNYYLFRSTSATTAGTRIAIIPATKATSYEYQDTGLVAGRTYWYRVLASGPTGQSAATDRISGSPVDNRYVSPPLNLTAQDRPYDQGGVVDLAWTKSGDDGAGAKIVTTYYIYRKMANVQVDPTKIAQVTANAAAQYTWSDTHVPLELILYEYTVKAVASNGAMSAAAGPARADAEDNNVLSFQPPTGFTVTDVAGGTGGQLLLSWHRSTSEGDIGPPPPPPVVFASTKDGYGGQYEFYRRTSTGTYSALPTIIVSAAGTNDPMTYTDSGLTDGTRYYYKARYRRFNQISPFTAEASATPVKSLVTTKEAAGEGASVTLESAVTGLSVSLLNPPASVVAGQDVLIGVNVRARGRSAVCLEYAAGASLARTAAVVGNGSYEGQIKLTTAGWPVGTTVQVRAVAAGNGLMTASDISAITVVAP